MEKQTEKNDHTEFVTMWCVQAKRVLETLDRDGIYYVKKSYVTEKYQESAWIFQEAYGFFVRKATPLMEKPKEAESPIWMFEDPMWAVADPKSVLMRLRIPKSEVLIFDLRKWNKILNLSYIGREEADEKRFKEKLRAQGIPNEYTVFEKPYYPMPKAEIVKSWESLFTQEEIEPAYRQGASWRLKKEWIEARME